MALNLGNLDERTRDLMLQELQLDIANKALYISDRLNSIGRTEYPELLRLAIQMGNEDSLAAKLRGGCFNFTYKRRNPKSGGYTNVTMPVNAPDMLAEGEFNRYYIRALCRRAIEDGNGVLRICRIKAVSNPRPESQIKIGQLVDPEKLLADLRENIGVDTALGIPAGPNSGLSVELVAV